ncbi:MAG: DNA gyrase subunit A [Hyphomicrobiales bacterium]|nr:DNA gyrase subunit A [Hyphomicrobiales bacterium]
MKKSYLDYAMSVIVSRALPDVRDGLKPVHRRILFSMHENNYDWNKAYRKSARVVGDVIGKYHPHGDQSIYDALVRMAQHFSLRLPLLDGQGNFGSVDGDKAAAMRYTEVRMEKVAHALMSDLDKDTVEFQENYDNSESEPTVLPSRFPNLLVNGAGGIAVGMATNIPPHNLGEIIDATIATVNQPDISLDELQEIIKGPDFPTGGYILGTAGIKSAYETGRGSVMMRAKLSTEEIRKDREAIVITEIPFQVNKTTLIEKIAELVRDKRVEGISDIRDESDRDGMRIVIEVKRDGVPDVIINQLYRYSQLQTSFGCNMVALNHGRPGLLNLQDFLTAFVSFREEVVTRRTKFLLNKARDRAHVLVGLAIAVANIDEIIKLIRAAPNTQAAREQLMQRNWPVGDIEPLIQLIADPRHVVSSDGTYRLSEAQARAILELRLARLTAMGMNEIGDELNKLGEEIKDYLDILGSRERVMSIIRQELTEIKDEFATPRRTEILGNVGDFDDEDMIPKEDMVVTVSHKGYIKRVALNTYRAQRRGGKGRSGMNTRDEDFVTNIFVLNTHTPVLFFSSKGMVYKLKVWRLPIGSPTSIGKALINLLPLDQGENITTIMPLPSGDEDISELNIMFATKQGNVRRNELSDFVQVNKGGKIAMKLSEGDEIVSVQICTDGNDVLLATTAGRSIRFAVSNVRVFVGRSSSGVRGIRLGDNVEVISMAILNHIDITSADARAYVKHSNALRRLANQEGEDVVEVEDTNDDANEEAVILSDERIEELKNAEEYILTLSKNGFGKRTSAYEYRVTGRGGKGIVAMGISKRNGDLIASFPVAETDQIMLVTDGGQLIRCPLADIRIGGRSTQGVTIFKTAKQEQVVSVGRISDLEGDDGEEDGADATDEADNVETATDDAAETSPDKQSDD